MATLSPEKKEKRKKRKWFIIRGILIVGLATMPYMALLTDQMLRHKFDFSMVNTNYLDSFKGLLSNKNQLSLFGCYMGAIGVLLFMIITNSQEKVGRSETIQITDRIEIPKPIGEGQHGTSRFLTEKEKDGIFYVLRYDPNKELKSNKNLGLVIGMEKRKGVETIRCIGDDLHTIVIGSTRSGKSRGLILQTIWLRSHTGKSMVITDPKGELYLYTKKFLAEKGYEVVDLDFRQPKKSKRYNYMSNINEAISSGDIPRAIDYTWDLVSVIVGLPKGEPLWTNGESAVIASGILAVAMEAPEEHKNLSNVYYFIANMCKEDEKTGQMRITQYFAGLPAEHPAKGIFAIAEISPERTRGSFFGSALATLRLFTNWNIADMTSKCDFDVKEIGKGKMALFIIVPDEKTTMYSLVSLLINQIYVKLVELANAEGGRVPVPVDFILDEFGNFPAIPSFGSMLAVGGGRGLRFTLVLQDYQQLEKHYKQDCENIKGNCAVTVYLKTPTQKTLEELSKRTGTYTCQVNSVNSSVSGRTFVSPNTSFSDSANMQSRALLMPDEVARIERPYNLVLVMGQHPGIFHAPDLSEYHANEELGLGDMEWNRKEAMKREREREERETHGLRIWDTLEGHKENGRDPEKAENEKISFLD